ncbi:MAG: glycosyltransferase family 2 protein, partial [Candidatus Krumholzibacteriia bacterium]
IPTYDRSEVLRRALRSVTAQTRAPDEIVVVDDGSTDDTPEWLPREFPGVRCVRQPHRGVSAARNRGVAESSGGWVAFLDSDDEWQPVKLERQLQALHADPGHALCHTNETWVRRGRRVNPKRRHAKSGGFIFRNCLPLCAISPSSVLLRRALFEEVGGFDESLPVCEDYDLWLRICCRYPVLFVDQPLVVKYGGHPDQLSRAYWGMDRFRIHALEKIVRSRFLRAGDREAALRVLVEKIDVYLEGARKRGKREDIRAYEILRSRYREQWNEQKSA